MKASLEHTTKKYNDTERALTAARKKIQEQEEETGKLYDLQDKLEQCMRKNSLEIHGVPESAYTETEDIVLKLAEALDVPDVLFTMKALDIFNFGTSIKRWIGTFYTNIESAAINNGLMTNWFRPLRGVHKGCPLSPYLFVFSTEVSSNKNETRTKYNRNQKIRERNQIERICRRHEPFLCGFDLC